MRSMEKQRGWWKWGTLFWTASQSRMAERLRRNPPELVTQGGQAVRQGLKDFWDSVKVVYIGRNGYGYRKERDYGKEYSSRNTTPRLPDIWARTKLSS
jgi:hypothetical protein